MKILLLEYITAGGLCDQPLPDYLLGEGLLMRDALFADFSEIADVEILTTYDVRVGLPKHANVALPLDDASKAMDVWQTLLQSCDYALIIAPEFDGILSTLTQLVERLGVKNLGARLLAVELFSNKYSTYYSLKQANILTIPTYSASEFLSPDFFKRHASHIDEFNNGCVAKPIDGAGCGDTYYFSNAAALQSWLSAPTQLVSQSRYIIQPYQAGIPASISMLCKAGAAWVLSCNQQLVEINRTDCDELNVFHAPIQYKGFLVNGLISQYDIFEAVAKKIAATFSELNGYIGVDVIINNDEIFVVEINPRITTSYIALRESLNCNPAKLILDLTLTESPNATFKLPENLTTNTVSIHINE